VPLRSRMSSESCQASSGTSSEGDINRDDLGINIPLTSEHAHFPGRLRGSLPARRLRHRRAVGNMAHGGGRSRWRAASTDGRWRCDLFFGAGHLMVKR
jgi:hypothetical protein